MGFLKVLDTGFRITKVVAEVATGATLDIAKGAAHTLEDTVKATQCLGRQDYDGACAILGKRIEGTFVGTVKRLEVAGELVEEAGKCLSDKDRPFLTKENTQKLTTVATVGLVSLAGVSFIDDDDIDDSESSDYIESSSGLLPSNAEIFTINNGIFEGDQSDLEVLARAGQIEGTEHLDAEELDRNLAVRDAFLHEHGYSSIPNGYEVHHIIPLSEGGADVPENMVLITEEEHNYITATHSGFYNWHA